ncbi:hypothetical protein [Chryseobacterium nematophagum]|uniref:hypothetical protein n=1 Tax=Chryseobacterium nematophagum TaxID=2305228 RepID=UPI001604A654|nr:hypothetical protein [Chryseobacterium nematophagum]
MITIQTTTLDASEMIPVKFLGHQKLFPVHVIQNLPDIVKRDILYPKLNDKALGAVEREKVTKRLISMLQIKFDFRPKESEADELSPQEMAMAEFGSFLRQYSLTGEEVLEAYRMGIKKQLCDVKGEIIQIYPNLSIIQAGEVLNAYMDYRRENKQHTDGVEKLKALVYPPKEISAEEIKAVRKRNKETFLRALEENKPCEHSFLYFNEVIKRGGLKSFLANKEAVKIAIYNKMRDILEKEKIKQKSAYFNSFEISHLSHYFTHQLDELPVAVKFAFEKLQTMAMIQVKNELTYNWFRKQIIKKTKMKILELKIDQEVIINTKKYLYKGIQKERIKGIGAAEKVVFEDAETQEEKLFELSVLSKKLKEKDGIIEFK